MCLNPNPDYKPESDPVIRYKVVAVDKKGRILSVFENSGKHEDERRIYKLGQKHRATWSPNRKRTTGTFGFHVMHTKEGAEKYLNILRNKRYWWSPFRIAKCKCERFLTGGNIPTGYFGGGLFSETWRYITILELLEED